MLTIIPALCVIFCCSIGRMRAMVHVCHRPFPQQGACFLTLPHRAVSTCDAAACSRETPDAADHTIRPCYPFVLVCPSCVEELCGALCPVSGALCSGDRSVCRRCEADTGDCPALPTREATVERQCPVPGGGSVQTSTKSIPVPVLL
jgi:hypothetical protein